MDKSLVTTMEVLKSTNKNLALYQIHRGLKNRSEAIDDAVSKAEQFEQLTSQTDEHR